MFGRYSRCRFQLFLQSILFLSHSAEAPAEDPGEATKHGRKYLTNGIHCETTYMRYMAHTYIDTYNNIHVSMLVYPETNILCTLIVFEAIISNSVMKTH